MFIQKKHRSSFVTSWTIPLLGLVAVFMIIGSVPTAKATHDSGGDRGPCTPYVSLSANLFDTDGNQVATAVHSGEYSSEATLDTASNTYIALDGSNRRVLALNIELRRADEQGGSVPCSGPPDPAPGNIDVRRVATRITPETLPLSGSVTIRVEIDYQCLGSTSLPSCVETTSATIGPFSSICNFTPNWSPASLWIVQDQLDGSGRTFKMAVNPQVHDSKFLADTYTFNFGDGTGNIEIPASQLTGSEPSYSHTWSTYGDFTLTFRGTTRCFRSPEYSFELPIHKFRLSTQAYRANTDHNIVQLPPLDGTNNQHRVELTNGQQSFLRGEIIDENGRHYASADILNWQETVIHYPPSSPGTSPRPLGQTFSENTQDFARYFYIPTWQLEGTQINEQQHLFDVALSAAKIIHQGLEIAVTISPVGSNFHIGRPQLIVQPTEFAISLPPNTTAERTFQIENRNPLPSNNNDAAMSIGQWTTNRSIQSPPGGSWLTTSGAQPVPLPARQTGSFLVSVNSTGLTAGQSYQGLVTVATVPDNVPYPSQDAWGHTINQPTVAQARIIPDQIPVRLTITEEPPSGDIPTVIGDVFSKGNASGIEIDDQSVISAGNVIDVVGGLVEIPGYQRKRNFNDIKQHIENNIVTKLINERAIRISNDDQDYQLGTFFNLNPVGGDPQNPSLNLANPAGGVWYVPEDLIFTNQITQFSGRGTIIVGGEVDLPPSGIDKKITYQNPTSDLLGIIVLNQTDDLVFENFQEVVGAWYVPDKAIKFIVGE